jgi:hypothetical protein
MANRPIAASLLLVMVLVAGACGDDIGASTSTVTPEAVTTSVLVTTTLAPSSTAASAASATSVLDATTLATGTTANDPALVLAHRGLIAGGNEYYFGDDPDDVVAAVTAALGAPIDDSGWLTDYVEGGMARSVNWGALWLAFSDTGPNGAFASYYFGGTPVPDGVAIVLPGITLGSTVTEVLAVVGMYREDVGLDQWEWVQGAILEKWVLQTGNGEFGYLCFDTGLDEQPSGDDTVRSVSAGVDCTVDGE